MARQHVVVLSRITPFHSSGGMQAVAWDIARSLAEDGLRVTFLTTEIEGREASFTEEGVEVEGLPGVPAGKYSRRWWEASLDYFLNHLVDSVDAVLSVSAAGYGLLPARQTLPGVRFVMQAHGTAIGEIVSKWRIRRPKALATSAYNALWLLRDLATYRKFDCVVCVGEAVYRSLRRAPTSWFLPRDRVTVIPNGVDTHVFSPDTEARGRARCELGWAQDHRVIVTVSRLHPQKGVEHALNGFAAYSARDPRARYLIVGGGSQEAELRDLSIELGVGEKVTFTGNVRRAKVADYLRAADAFLFTNTREEGLPLNLLEAAAVGLPLVVSESLLGLASSCSVARGVAPRDVGSIASALESMLSTHKGPIRPEPRLPREYSLEYCAQRYRQVLLSEPCVTVS